jgi:hypothetical protein
MKNTPEVRPSPSLFSLCYFPCEVATDGNRKIVGYTITLRISYWLRPEYLLSACVENWRPFKSFTFGDHEYVLNAAEEFFGICKADWIGSHPPQGSALYAQPRSSIERLHRRLLRAFDRERRQSAPAFSGLRQAGGVPGARSLRCMRVGRFPRFGGGAYLWHSAEVMKLESGFGLPLENFICLLCCDVVTDDAKMDAVIRQLSALGAVGFCCYGEGGDRFYQRIHLAAEGCNGALMPEARAWFVQGSLSDAVAFFLDKSSPAERYLGRCSAAVAVVITPDQALAMAVRDAMLEKWRQMPKF